MEEKSKTKQQRSVVHLYLKEKDEHIYFGSVANIFEFFTKEDIGISFGSLRNYVLSPNKPYDNKLVIIRKGLLRAKPKATKGTLKKDMIDSGIKVSGKEQLPNETILTQNSTTTKPKKVFDKNKLEHYLSDRGHIRHFKFFKKRGLIPEKTEYKELVNSICKHHSICKNNSNSVVYSNSYKVITELLSKICIDENEINKYKKLIDAKLAANKKTI